MATRVSQLALFPGTYKKDNPAFSNNKNEPIHRWTPWIAGFSADFVRGMLQMHPRTKNPHTVMYPFAGVGTTLVETLRCGDDAVGFEINPYAALVTKTKLASIKLNPDSLEKELSSFRKHLDETLSSPKHGRPGHVPPPTFRTRVPFFSEQVLHKVLHCWDYIESIKDTQIRNIFKIAFGSVMVSFSNYSYEPSLSRRQSVGRQDITDAPVPSIIEGKLQEVLSDIRLFQEEIRRLGRKPRMKLYCQSFFTANRYVRGGSVDLIITSPPYLNNYHYIRNTRPQIHWLGLYRDGLLEHLEQQNVGKFWQTVRGGPCIQLEFDNPKIDRLIGQIREQNPHRGIYGGKGWANYAASYYNDTYRFLRIFKRVLKRRGVAVIVLGNSIVQGVNLEVDQHIADMGERIGLRVVDIQLLRKKRVGSSIIGSSVRRASNTKGSLHESAVILQRR